MKNLFISKNTVMYDIFGQTENESKQLSWNTECTLRFSSDFSTMKFIVFDIHKRLI